MAKCLVISLFVSSKVHCYHRKVLIKSTLCGRESVLVVHCDKTKTKKKKKVMAIKCTCFVNIMICRKTLNFL